MNHGTPGYSSKKSTEQRAPRAEVPHMLQVVAKISKRNYII